VLALYDDDGDVDMASQPNPNQTMPINTLDWHTRFGQVGGYCDIDGSEQ